MKELALENMEEVKGGSALQCALGTTGGAVLGGLAGARTGSMLLPGKGTFWGGGYWDRWWRSCRSSCFLFLNNALKIIG